MSIYSLLRRAYRWGNRVVLKRLPYAVDWRLHALVLPLARRLFPGRIVARSACEFSGSTQSGQGLPAWARDEVAALVALEPELAALAGPDASPELYLVPWDMNYVGLRYASARRQLHGGYAGCALLGGEAGAATAALLAAAPRPMAIIDVAGAEPTAQLARELGADYVALPAEHLDANDHCAVLARLVLQLAPRQLFHQKHPLIDRCVTRHGLALGSVSSLVLWAASERDGEVAQA